MAAAARRAYYDPDEALAGALERVREGLVADGHVAAPAQPAPGPPAPEPEPEPEPAPSDAATLVPLHPPASEPPAVSAPRRRTVVGAVVRFSLGLTLGLSAAVAAFYALLAPLIDPPLPTRPERLAFVTADGVPLGVTRTGGRGRIEAKDAFGTRAEWPPVTLAQLPDHVEHAVLAREDHKFREHWGVRPDSLAAAAAGCAVNRLRGRGCGRGASTLHMQVARGGFRERPGTAAGKAWEIALAFWVARRWSRDEVLERYLNDAYWGAELHGLNAASWRYLRKRPAQLTLAEGALLAGMLSAPNRTDPFADRVRARRERDEVLSAMARRGFVTPAEAARAKAAPLPARRPQPKPETTQSRAFLRWVAPEAAALDPRGRAEQLALALDTRVQAAAYAAADRRLAGRPELQAAVVVIRPDGRVAALTGGRTPETDTGRADRARRSPASTAKLFTYAEALKRGWRPDDTLSGEPVTVGDYTPRNHGGATYGELTLEEAFARSVNTAAVRLNEDLEPARVAKLAARTGVTIPERAGAAAPLGAFEVDLLTLTAAYAGLANNCVPLRPTGLNRTDASADCDRLLNRRAHGDLMRLLRAGAAPGATGAAAGAGGLPVGGKTGTSAESRDALFVGVLETARGPVTVGVWVGVDKGAPRNAMTGGAAPAQIFADVTRALVRAGW